MLAAVSTYIAILLAGGFPSALDEWPDGIVDRGLQCDIFPDRIEVEMSVGLSDATVIQALQTRLPTGTTLASTPDGQLDQLRAISLEELMTAITLEIDGVPLELKAVRSEISARHHIRFYCYLEAKLEPLAGERRFQLIDGSFPELQNQLRIALRPRGTELGRTNVAPLIVRADRIYMIDLSRDDRLDARTIRATFVDPNVEASPIANDPESEVDPSPADSVDESTDLEPTSEPSNSELPAVPTQSAAPKPSEVPESEALSARSWGLQIGLTFFACLLLIIGCLLLVRADFANRFLRR